MYTVHGIYRAGQDTAGKKRCGAARRPGARTERLSMQFVRCARGPARSTAADNPLPPSRRVMFRETKKKKTYSPGSPFSARVQRREKRYDGCVKRNTRKRTYGNV